MKRARRHSLSGRLLGLFLLTGLALALVVKTGFQIAFQDGFRGLARPHVAEYVSQLLREIGDPPDTVKAAELAQRLPLEIHITAAGTDWSSAGSPPDLSQARLHPHRLTSGEAVRAGRIGDDFVLVYQTDDYRVILQPQGLEATDWAPWALLFTLFGVLTALALAYHGIRRLFLPLQEISTGLAHIGQGDLEHRIQVKRRDELGELAENVNRMADDIREMLDAKRQLLLAISHELRSPLTRARVNLALLPESETRRTLEADIAEMVKLTEELLESERLNSRHAALNLSAEDPAALVGQVIAEHFPDRNILAELDLEIGYVALDPVRFKLLVRNLLENALRHTPTTAPAPAVSLSRQTAGWTLSVRDQGPGIAPEHLAKITQPFYRADPSRHRNTGGCGLGLYLSRMIAEAHGGCLEVESRKGHGLLARVRFATDAKWRSPNHVD